MTPAASAGPRWVALGSSFAAGPGIAPNVDRGAMRSGRNYAHLVAEALGADLIDASCSGATTAHLLRDPQRTLAGSRPPQLEAVGPDTTHVSITVGGNDLNFVGALTIAAARHLGTRVLRRAHVPSRWLPPGTAAPVDDQSAADLARALADVVVEVRRRAPGARVLLVDYLTLIGGASADQLGLSADDAEVLRETEAQLQQTFVAVADGAGAELVAVSATSRSHGYASTEPWVTGLSLPRPGRRTIPFHPNAAGMRHVADEILRHLG